ncbi:MAG: peptidoglycan -binding protein [Rhodospirillaceae bacterium]|jgi:chemotaxis protein MotB|nr:peptidoglycan -binding protein [Rhodospirillaceae bacterium]MBT4938952.1 peptidoglycan -binding protein [Rhodospirillaceae bacterium]
MAALSRRNQHRTDIWPGFVDALATLLMVIIFLLMIFVIAQFFLSETLTSRDQALDRLRGQVSELADLLNLERKANATLRTNMAQLSDELSASVSLRDDQKLKLQSLTLRAETAGNQAKKLKSDLASAMKSVETDQAKIKLQLSQIAALSDDIEKLTALREDLEAKVKASLTKLASKDETIITEKKLSKTARAEVALLNKQLRALRQQIAQIADTLDASEAQAKKQRTRIANLGKRLNAALASKVQELSHYRSEFFGKLREVLGNQKGIRIVGDRFVFQSEVLFTTGSAELGTEGKTQITQLAGTLKDITKKIPPKIEWVLRVDGHTDAVPIKTSRFPSNWELSTARAISVVKYLVSQGILPTNLAATGFGEFQPIDPRDDEIANRRNRRIELKLTQR